MMTVAFAIWAFGFQWLLPALRHVLWHALTGFPGTLMILSGWAPVVGYKVLSERRKAKMAPVKEATTQAPPPEPSNLPIK